MEPASDSDSLSAEELDKFKRRLIRAVARLLLHEKKSEEEIWKELKEDTGYDCKLLWMRMRALTVKKMDRLLIANDRTDSVPKPAQMSLTDWLLFDLVLVHQKIDVIGQINAKDKEDRPVLVELFEMVKMFDLEALYGEDLAEAWSMATLYYNKKGHQCSPMLLQRRWYQLKEVTRFKFYDFWYAYRGNLTRVKFAEPFKPSPLQTAIAKYFKKLVLEPFPDWDDLINRKLVSMPDEFEKQMKERAALRCTDPQPSEDGPDLMMIEPTIDTVDLRLDRDVNATNGNMEGKEVPTLVRIKEEPRDDMDFGETQTQTAKKSIYEIVLESMVLENEQLDNMDADEELINDSSEIEKVEAVRYVEESALPQITNVFGNVSDTSILTNIHKDRVYGNAENAEVFSNVDSANVGNVEDTNVCSNVDSASVGNVEDTNVCSNVDSASIGNVEDTNVCSNVDSASVGNVEDTNVCSNVDSAIVGNVEDTNVCSNVDSASVGIVEDSNVCSNVDSASVGNVKDSNVCSNVDSASVGNVEDSNVFSNVVSASVGIVEDSNVCSNVDGASLANVEDTNVCSNVDSASVGNVEDSNVCSNVVSASVGIVEDTNVCSNVVSASVGIVEDSNVCSNVDSASVGNVEDSNVCSNVDSTSVGIVEDSNVCSNVDGASLVNVEDTDVCSNIDGASVVNVDDTNVCNGKNIGDDHETVGLDDVLDGARDVEKHISVWDISNNHYEEVIDVTVDDNYNVGDTNRSGGGYISVPGEITEISDDEDISCNVDANANVFGNADETYVAGSHINTINFTGNVNAISVIDNPVEASVTSNVEVIDSETGNIVVIGNVGGNVEITSKPIAYKNESNEDVLHAQMNNTAPTNMAEGIKNVEIIDTSSPPFLIIDSDDDDDIIVKDLVTNKSVTKTNEDYITTPKSTIVEPMDADSAPEVSVSFPEPLKVSGNEEMADDNDGNKGTNENIPGLESFMFGELPSDISFADEGIVYVDEDNHDETNKCNDEDGDKAAPKTDDKLLKCPIVYTTRLDDMSLLLAQPFASINDKRLLDVITKKSKPILKVENDNNETKGYESRNTIADVPINNNVTSEDDDCHANVIDESKKVKPTSYLLQKPRSRKYNPIQLCKNPDFNTRLKRLSVGFFGSPRNRVLIKSCKPLTIDVNKAFESKLISGTLYLKPVDHNVVTEVIDDTESQNVSVLPSAMPAQSLIDNSKVTDILPMLRQCLEASKQPEVVAPTIERNKVINLPDITEIRRINQKLLTAEITPIQVQNNQPQVPVTIVTSLDTPTYPVPETVPIAETKKDFITEATDARGPPRLLDITDDPPTETTTEATPPTGTTGRHTLVTFGPGLVGLIGPVTHRPTKTANGKRIFPPNMMIWQPKQRQSRPQIPWLTRGHSATVHSKNVEDTLLTLDALNKMLFLLTDKLEPEAILPKKKNTPLRKNCDDQPKQPRGRPKKIPKVPACKPAPSKVNEPPEERKKKCQSPKFNLRPATSHPPAKVAANKPVLAVASEPAKSKVFYCCWARQRMLQMLFCRQNIPPHDCPKRCLCCCRSLLEDYVLHDQKIKRKEMQLTIKNVANSSGQDKGTASDDGTDSSKTVEAGDDISIQTEGTSAQVPDVEKDQVPELENTPVIDIEVNHTKPASNTDTENEIFYIDVMDTECDVPVVAGEESVTTTALVAHLTMQGPATPANATSENSLVTAPALKNLNLISSVTPHARNQAFRYPRCYSSDKNSRSITFNAVKKTPVTTSTETIKSPPSLTNILAIKKATLPIKVKTTVRPSPIINKPIAPPQNIKEKMIFLNSKHISEKPKTSPVFLGKNKILLTTIKFPPKLKSFQEAKDALRRSLKLPYGVHLVMLPNETISYKIDQNVEVNATDMAAMPAIIAAVQAHMDACAAQKEILNKSIVPLSPGITDGEVVDLVEDDDEPLPNVNLNENNKTVTKNSDDCVDSHNTQKDAASEINDYRTDLNIDTNVIETETGCNQNESVDKNIVIDNLPKPSTQPEQEGSAELAQDQYKKSVQNVNIEDRVPATEIVRTDVLQKSTCNPSRPKTKNILSDLMEMSGIFDEDLAPEIEETQVVRPAQQLALAPALLATSLPVSTVVEPAQKVGEPAQTDVEPAQKVVEPQGKVVAQNIVKPPEVNTPPPKLKSPVGELTPITSLYELKYACANKGSFFKLDFETGFLVPINVCMKSPVQKSAQRPVQTPKTTTPRNISPKAVIDLTEDENKAEENNTETDISPSKRSLLLVNNLHTRGFTGPVKPVKLFKALKPSILHKLNQNKMRLNHEKKHALKTNDLDLRVKRKQFLRTINLNADTDAGVGYVRHDSSVPVRQYAEDRVVRQDLINKYIGFTDTADNQPTPTTSCSLSDNDSSDDEPLAKKAKRKNDKVNAPEYNKNVPDSVTRVSDVELPAAGIELEAPVVEHFISDDNLSECESELPTPDVEHFISDDDIDLMDPVESFGFDLIESNGEDEYCILGV